MKRILLSLLALLGLAGGARAADYSDLWFNPLEPGYGMTVVQQGESAFVTLYVYAGNGEPMWLVSPDARVYGYLGAYPQFRGTLYRTRGPAYSGPYDPRQVEAIPVGTLFLSSTHESVLELEYNVNNVAVRKQLTRQTFAHPDATAWYSGSFRLRMSLPGSDTPFGVRDYNADFLFHMTEQGEAVLRVEEPVTGICEYRGPYHQSGRYGYFSGSFTCARGPGGAFDVSRLEITTSGITGHLATFAAEIGRGRFGAVRH
ncbi:MAG TPA: hypothetical protein VEC19_05310 [Usitatibacter sp.]|nr:hypothetical protein [Usitatibacter sp.]